MARIYFGKRWAEIIASKWDDEGHVGFIEIIDNKGHTHVLESDGLSPHEQRQAVVSWMLLQARALDRKEAA